jgi:hypothetical protein
MDWISLKDLPLALAFGIVCLWFYNQSNVAHGKRYVELIEAFGKDYKIIIENYDKTVDFLSEERRQWLIDLRGERAILLDTLNKNTEAQVKNANETHALRNSLSAVFLKPKRGTYDDSK